MSYPVLHSVNKRATPDQMCTCKHALVLYELMDSELPKVDWKDTHFQQTLNNRRDAFFTSSKLLTIKSAAIQYAIDLQYLTIK